MRILQLIMQAMQMLILLLLINGLLEIGLINGETAQLLGIVSNFKVIKVHQSNQQECY